MKRNMLLLLTLCFILTPVANVDAVTIHDVVIGGASPPGQPATDTDGLGCAQLIIGTTGAGTDYGTFKIVSADGVNPATIQAIENGASCYNQTPDSVRDQLLLVNADIIVNQSGGGLPLILNYYADFGSSPDGYAGFSGYMKGVFRKNNVGVTCTISATCNVVYDVSIYSQYDGIWHALPAISQQNPLGGIVNKAIPSTSIQMGTGLARTHNATVTVYLPYPGGTPPPEYKLSISGSNTFKSTNHGPKMDRDHLGKSDGKSMKIDPVPYSQQFKGYKVPGVGPDPGPIRKP